MTMRSTPILLGSLLIGMSLGACGGHDAADKDEKKRDASQGDVPPQTTNQPPTASSPGDGEPASFQLSEGTVSKKGSFYVKLEWQDRIVANRHLAAKLTFLDAAGHAPKSVSQVSFEPHMPSMGHGTMMDDQTIEASTTQANVFLVKGAYLIMGGQWEVKIGATVNGVIDTAAVAFKAR